MEVYPELKRLLKENPQFLEQLSDLELDGLKFDFYIFAAATPMTAADYVSYQTARAVDLRARILSDPAAPQALVAAATDVGQFTNFYLASLQQAGVLRPEDTPPPARTGAAFDSNVAVPPTIWAWPARRGLKLSPSTSGRIATCSAAAGLTAAAARRLFPT